MARFLKDARPLPLSPWPEPRNPHGLRIEYDPWTICSDMPWKVMQWHPGDGYFGTLRQYATWREALEYLIRAWPVLT